MEITKDELNFIIKSVVEETVNSMPIVRSGKLSVLEKVEFLLLNYHTFKRIVAEKDEEIEELKSVGIRYKVNAVHVAPANSLVNVGGIRLASENVDDAIRTVQASVKVTVQALRGIEKGMERLKNDPFYEILKLIYFDGETQESVANRFGCTQQYISKQKNRLLKELAMEVFPDDFLVEMLS